MRASEAPPAGWYPDPEGGSRLRWWEGTDWSDRYRPRPYTSVSQIGGMPPVQTPHARPQVDVQLTGVDNPALLVEQMRQAARGEADRAVQQLEQRARQMRAEFKPLVTQYTSRVLRFFKRLAFLVVLLVVVYFLFQLIAQQSLLDWLGDRIDNATATLHSAQVVAAATQ